MTQDKCTQRTLAQALIESISDATIPRKFTALQELATRYANIIDNNPNDVQILKDFGPRLLQVLKAMDLAGATFKTPSSDGGGNDANTNDPSTVANPSGIALTQLRNTYGPSARANRTTYLHATS